MPSAGVVPLSARAECSMLMRSAFRPVARVWFLIATSQSVLTGFTIFSIGAFALSVSSSEVTEVHTLTFKNKDARPKTMELVVSIGSVEPIMAWYGAYYAGDRYKVFLDGQRLQIDQNGEWVRHAN